MACAWCCEVVVATFLCESVSMAQLVGGDFGRGCGEYCEY